LPDRSGADCSAEPSDRPVKHHWNTRSRNQAPDDTAGHPVKPRIARPLTSPAKCQLRAPSSGLRLHRCPGEHGYRQPQRDGTRAALRRQGTGAQVARAPARGRPGIAIADLRRTRAALQRTAAVNPAAISGTGEMAGARRTGPAEATRLHCPFCWTNRLRSVLQGGQNQTQVGPSGAEASSNRRFRLGIDRYS